MVLRTLAGLQREMPFEKWKLLNECLFTDYLSPVTVIVGALTFTTGPITPLLQEWLLGTPVPIVTTHFLMLFHYATMTTHLYP